MTDFITLASRAVDVSSDSKADLNIHLEVLSKKSPTKSPFKRIKLKKRFRSNETEDNKRSIQDEIVVKEVMKNLLDKIAKEESHFRS